MDNLEDVTRLPDDFDGRVRLFPLPELVVFPHAMQPLHIFEPRYCDMLSDALAADRLIAMSTLTGGIAATSAHEPPIATTVCLGKVLSHAEVEADRHNILLVGIQRARIIREIETGRPFRIAEVQVEEDIYPPSGADSRVTLKKELLEAFAEVIPVSENVQRNLHELMAGKMGLGPITDIISYTLPFDCEAKLDLLAQPDVDSRAQQLIEMLQSGSIELHSLSVEEQTLDSDSLDPHSMNPKNGSQQSPDERFPPPFSLN